MVVMTARCARASRSWLFTACFGGEKPGLGHYLLGCGPPSPRGNVSTSSTPRGKASPTLQPAPAGQENQTHPPRPWPKHRLQPIRAQRRRRPTKKSVQQKVGETANQQPPETHASSFPFATGESGDSRGDLISSADSAGSTPLAPLLVSESVRTGRSAAD